eukprot:2709508-Rhodomonas_salina.1
MFPEVQKQISIILNVLVQIPPYLLHAPVLILSLLVLISASCYGMPGTEPADVWYQGSVAALNALIALFMVIYLILVLVCGTELGDDTMLARVWDYGMSSTERGYGAMRVCGAERGYDAMLARPPPVWYKTLLTGGGAYLRTSRYAVSGTELGCATMGTATCMVLCDV